MKKFMIILSVLTLFFAQMGCMPEKKETKQASKDVEDVNEFIRFTPLSKEIVERLKENNKGLEPESEDEALNSMVKDFFFKNIDLKQALLKTNLSSQNIEDDKSKKDSYKKDYLILEAKTKDEIAALVADFPEDKIINPDISALTDYTNIISGLNTVEFFSHTHAGNLNDDAIFNALLKPYTDRFALLTGLDDIETNDIFVKLYTHIRTKL